MRQYGKGNKLPVALTVYEYTILLVLSRMTTLDKVISDLVIDLKVGKVMLVLFCQFFTCQVLVTK